MLSKNKTKLIQSLGSKKYRQKYNKFIVEGHKTCIEFIKSGKYEITDIIAYDEWSVDNKDIIEKRGLTITIIPPAEMKTITHFSTPSPVVLICEIPEKEEIGISDLQKIIYLDDIQDPGNLGTIIRIADWFGIQAILTSIGTVDKFNPKVISGSMGSFINVPVLTDYGNLMEEITGSHSFIGADMNGKEFSSFKFPEKSVLCMGNEGHGLSSALITKINDFVSIPGSPGKIADSLNVSMAAAILCASWKTRD